MRSTEDIANIKSRISDPYAIENIIDENDISLLIEFFKNTKDKIHKNTGPITVDIPAHTDHPIFLKILKQLESHIGQFEITSAFFFWTNFPHIIHNDDTFELPAGVYKGITIPLEIEGTATPKLCFFDQFYFQGPAKFFQGSKNIPTYYNKQVYDYTDVDGWTGPLQFDESTRQTYLTHLLPNWLNGLTFWGTLDWRPGNALIFDSTRLHCASDFRQQGIKSKLGISIFTKVP